MIRKSLPVVIGFLLVAAFEVNAGEGAASRLCDGFEAASSSEKVNHIVHFQQSRGSGKPWGSRLESRYLACLEHELDKMAEGVATYCESWEASGHGSDSLELLHLDNALGDSLMRCEDETFELLKALHQESFPQTCAELVASNESIQEILVGTGVQGKVREDCIAKNLSLVVGPIQAKCEAGDISIREADREVYLGLLHVCPKDDKAK